ncbi:MAG: proteasome assembly chaperone family protein [Euryarchaeota archaeon]|nr:proteasome assembly chaperone family protein [Euryarchaeota archaeon]
MEKTLIRLFKEPKLDNPMFIEGLPGIGHVGKLAAEHLVAELKAEKIGEVYSPSFPPQVLIKSDGTVELMKNEVFFWRGKKPQSDLLLLVGNTQGLTPEGQYDLADKILDLVEKFGVKKMFTLGGFATGKLVEEPRVFGAVTDTELAKELEKYGVVVKGEEGGGIVGASGLLLGLGKVRGMQGICLLGETSGYLVDARSAQAVLEVLTKMLGVKINMTELENRAKDTEKFISRLQEMERRALEQMPRRVPASEEDLRYIG